MDQEVLFKDVQAVFQGLQTELQVVVCGKEAIVANPEAGIIARPKTPGLLAAQEWFITGKRPNAMNADGAIGYLGDPEKTAEQTRNFEILKVTYDPAAQAVAASLRQLDIGNYQALQSEAEKGRGELLKLDDIEVDKGKISFTDVKAKMINLISVKNTLVKMLGPQLNPDVQVRLNAIIGRIDKLLNLFDSKWNYLGPEGQERFRQSLYEAYGKLLTVEQEIKDLFDWAKFNPSNKELLKPAIYLLAQQIRAQVQDLARAEMQLAKQPLAEFTHSFRLASPLLASYELDNVKKVLLEADPKNGKEPSPEIKQRALFMIMDHRVNKLRAHRLEEQQVERMRRDSALQQKVAEIAARPGRGAAAAGAT